MASYHVGDTAHLTSEFAVTTTDQLADPTTVTVSWTDPNGNTTTVTPVRDSQGVYHYDLLLTLAGVWQYSFVGTGAVAATGHRQLIVNPPGF